MVKRSTTIFAIFIIIAVVLAVVFLTNTNDGYIGSFRYIMIGDADKYEYYIVRGINRWAKLDVEGVTLKFKVDNTLQGNTIASTSGTTISINESVFNSYSTTLKILTIAHEVGHALGIGYWGDNNIVKGAQDYLNNTTFPKTAAAYVNNVRPQGITIPGPPIEDDGHGAGSDGAHWDNDQTLGMQRDLMTFSISSTATVISIVDLTYLSEIGRKVDLSKAESLNGTVMSAVTGMFTKEEKANCGNCCDHKHDE